jgi:RNA polymerase sigma factor (sigma-70 family)
MNDVIIDHVMKSESLNNYINFHFRNKDINLKNDFKQEFYLVLLEYDIKELKNIYNRGGIEKFCMQILKNKLESKSNIWYKVYISNGFWDINFLKTYDEYNEFDSLPIEDDIIIRKEKERLEDNRIERIENILLHTEPTSSLLFKLKYFKGYSYNQLSEMTGVNYQVIRNKIKSVLEVIKGKNI